MSVPTYYKTIDSFVDRVTPSVFQTAQGHDHFTKDNITLDIAWFAGGKLSWTVSLEAVHAAKTTTWDADIVLSEQDEQETQINAFKQQLTAALHQLLA